MQEPKYQVSAFKGGRMGKQYVMRSDDKAEFEELDKYLDTLIIEEADATESWGHYCPECGEKQEFRQGVSQKGRAWSAYFCTKDDKHTPSWRKYEGK